MNILFLSGMANRGGTENATCRLITLINSFGHKVFLASDIGPMVKEIEPLLKEHLAINLYGGGVAYLRDVFKLVKFVRNNDIDVMHCQMARPILACCLVRLVKPSVGIIWHSRGLSRKSYPYVCKLFSLLRVFAIANAKKERIKLIKYGYKADYVYYSYNPLPKLNNIHSINKKNENSDIHLVSVSRLASERNIKFSLDVLKSIMRENQNIHLNIVGAGPELIPLIHYAEKEGVSDFVTFHGALNFDELSKVYGKSDIAISTLNLSGDDGAGVGNNNLEAGVFSLPVVAFDSCAVKEIIVNGVTGFCIPLNDNALFISKVNELINSPTLRVKLGEKLHKHVDSLCSDRAVYRETLTCYKQSIGSK